MTITANKIIEARDITDFAAQCATAIAAGWQPYGPPFAREVLADPSVKMSLCQAFVQGNPNTNNTVPPTPNVGIPGAGVTAVEYGDGQLHQTRLTIASVLPAIAGGAALGVGSLIYTFPAGAQLIESAYMSVGVTQTQGHINANTPAVGLGTTIASGAVSVLSGTAGFQNVIVGTAAANCTGTPTVLTASPSVSPFTLALAAAAAKTLYYNAAATWAASGDAAALLAGTVVINWRTMA